MKLAEGTFAGLAGSEVDLFRQALSGMEGTGVEIGCLDGFSTAHILGFSKLHLTSIDPLIPDSMEPSLIGQVERLAQNVAVFPGRHEHLRDYSWNVASQWTRPLDFLFIDGDHRYESVLRDFLEWTPKLRGGGILAIHDSRMSRPCGAGFHPGPSQVAAECIYAAPGAWEIVGEVFSLTVARKVAS